MLQVFDGQIVATLSTALDCARNCDEPEVDFPILNF